MPDTPPSTNNSQGPFDFSQSLDLARVLEVENGMSPQQQEEFTRNSLPMISAAFSGDPDKVKSAQDAQSAFMNEQYSHMMKERSKGGDGNSTTAPPNQTDAGSSRAQTAASGPFTKAGSPPPTVNDSKFDDKSANP